MKEMFEQWTKTMEKMWEPWKSIVQESPVMQKMELPFKGNWSSWVAAVRSTYEVNTSWWQTFMDNGEGMFFKMYKESPFYSQALEEQIRECWEAIKRAQEKQQETIKQQFEKMESMLKESEKP